MTHEIRSREVNRAFCEKSKTVVKSPLCSLLITSWRRDTSTSFIAFNYIRAITSPFGEGNAEGNDYGRLNREF